MASDAEINSVNTDVLKGIKGVPDSNLNTNDFSNWVPEDMSPSQKALYKQQQTAQKPVTGALGLHDYYPDANHQIGVGNYGGSEIGSTTLFAPGGGLVPLGMMDARDAAVHKAALTKMKDLEDFHNKWDKSPETKLVNIQPRLTEDYHNFLQNAWHGAMKKAGNDPNLASQYIESSPDFKQKHQSYLDLAKYGNDIVEKVAKDDLDIKTGRFTPTPSYNEAKEKLLKASDPNSPEFKNMGNYFRTMHVERDFADAFNDVTKQLVMNQTGSAYPVDSPEFLSTYKTTLKSYTPEQKAVVKKHLEDIYAHSDYFTPAKIAKEVDGLLSATQKETSMTAHMKPEGDGDQEFYKTAPRMEGGGANVGHAENIPEGTLYKNMEFKSIYPASNYGTKQVLSAVNSPNQIDLASGKKNETIGNFNFNLQGVAVYPYNKKTNKVFSKEEIANGALKDNPDVEYKVGAVANTIPKKDSDGNEVGGSSQTLILPPEEVVGRVDKHGDKGFDLQIKRAKEEAKQLNLKHAEDAVTPKFKTINGHAYTKDELKGAGWTDEQIKELKSE